MDSNPNFLLAIVIIAAAVAVIFYLKKHSAAVTAAVKSAAAGVQSHVSGVVANAQADLTQSIVTAPLTARVATQVPLSPGVAVPSATAATATASNPPAPTNAAADVGNVIETPRPTATPTPAWPQIITVDGVRIMAQAVFNPAWKPSMLAHIMGSQGTTYVFEPSNGDKAIPPRPLRSAAGFPLVYALAGDSTVVGTPSVLYGEQTFNSDAEVFDYIARSAASDAAQQAAAARQWAEYDQRLAAQPATPSAPSGETEVAIESEQQ